MMKIYYSLCLFIGLMLSSLAFASYQESIDKGERAFQRGHFELAVQSWAEVLSNILPEKNPKRYIDTSVRLSAAFQSLGRLKEAHKALQDALSHVDKINDSEHRAVRHANVLMQLSDVYVAMRDFQKNRMDCGMKEISRNIIPFLENETLTPKGMINEALYYLDKSEKVLAKIGDRKKYPLLWANILNRKGNLLLLETNLARQNEQKEAQDKYLKNVVPVYRNSIDLLEKLLANLQLEENTRTQAKILRAKTAVNVIRGTVDFSNSEYFQSKEKGLGVDHETVLQWIREMPDSHDKAFALISFAKLMQKWPPEQVDNNTPLSSKQKLFAYNVLVNALDVAQSQQDYRSLIYTLFELAKLYAEEQRYHEAIPLTRKAIFYALNYPLLRTEPQKELWGYPDILYRLEWHLGKFLKAQGFHYSGTPEEHQKAVRDAYDSAAKHLKQTRMRYGSLPATFYEERENIYFELADVILQQASNTFGDKKQVLLKEAIKVIEQLNTAEVQNYFQDECITEQLKEKNKHLDKRLPDKVAVFYPLLFEDRIELLLTSNDGIQHKTVRPTMSYLKQHVDDFQKTLSGWSSYTIGRKTIAKNFYDWFFKPIEVFLSQQEIKTLIIVPYRKVHNIPFAALLDDKGHYLIEKPFTLVFTPGIELTNFSDSLPRDNIHALINGSDFKGNYGVSPLEEVPQELENITQVFAKNFDKKNVNVLENDKFTFDNLKERLEEKPYSVVHCATHAKVIDDPNIKFILFAHKTGKEEIDKIHLKKLENLFTGIAKRFSVQPIKLLTLSACETAKETGRMGLGLAGLLLKTRIPSTVGTLWKVEAKSSGILMTEFYKQLIEYPDLSKAEALQKAQQKLLKMKEYSHPYFWAPYLLIGNWL